MRRVQTCVAIGQFDEAGYPGPGMIDRPGHPLDGSWIVPYGREVGVRRVREGHSWSFNISVEDDPDVEGEELENYVETHCVEGSSIWAHEGRYKCLEAWLNHYHDLGDIFARILLTRQII